MKTETTALVAPLAQPAPVAVVINQKICSVKSTQAVVHALPTVNHEIVDVIKPKKKKKKCRPKILTHIIEGFIIQEAPEPFPVGISFALGY